MNLDLAARGERREDAQDIRLIGTDDGWKSPVYGELSQAYEAIKTHRRGML